MLQILAFVHKAIEMAFFRSRRKTLIFGHNWPFSEAGEKRLFLVIITSDVQKTGYSARKRISEDRL
ncbi:MAG: hypothetical protein AMJ75_03455 [Phycisphaerae bacterium SM1_79]|nr:MAG: hypothetical protein AMJ75_03455 [Phycisphaerae bacterium SM1_79]